MAQAASQIWKDGVLIERARETNRYRVLPDGTLIERDDEEIEATATKPYKAPVPTKMVAEAETENKAVRRTESKKASKK